MDIEIAALNTRCVKPEPKGVVKAVNDMAAEIERLREENQQLVFERTSLSGELIAVKESLRDLRQHVDAVQSGEMQAEIEKLRDALQELLDFSDTLQGRYFARSMKARLDAGALLNSESSGN